MITLPPIPKLIARTKALATLDLILSPEWDSRYYSFNSRWAPGEQMASMRNGSGDEWWILFHRQGWAALKGLDHESPAWSKGREQLSNALCSAIPIELSEFAQEPAFRWDATSFAYFYLSDSTGWKRANDLTAFAGIKETGENNLLEHVVGKAEDYACFAESYFEKSIPIEIVRAVFDLQPITESLIAELNPQTDFDAIKPELFDEIAYPES